MQRQLLIDAEVGKLLHFIGLRPICSSKISQILLLSGEYFTPDIYLDYTVYLPQVEMRVVKS